MLTKLRTYVRQQHIGLLALFIALGGSAYAASTIAPKNSVDSKSIVDRQVKNVDIANGAVTGAKVRNGSLTGADISHGTVPNAGKLAGHPASAYGLTVRTTHQPAFQCDNGNAGGASECAPVTVTVPRGRKYHAVVWSSFSGKAPDQTVSYCPAVKSASFALRCLTPASPPNQGDTLSMQYSYAESGAVSGDTADLGFSLGQGTWTLSTLLKPVSFFAGDTGTVHTTVLVNDATAPGPPGVATHSVTGAVCQATGSSGEGC